MNLKRWGFIITLSLAGKIVKSQDLDTSFSKQWIAIDSLIGISHLPKSALDKVNQVYQLSTDRSNKVQQIKALLYRIAIENKISETNINQNIKTLRLGLNKSKDPSSRALLHVLIAKQYLEYFNDHRWQLYERMKINSQTSKDILSWSADDYLKNIEAEYNAALAEKEWLKKTKLNPYSSIIWKGNAEKIRPTLYDVIAQDALDYFKTGQESRTKPINDYRIQQEESLGTYSEFATLKLIGNDSNAHLFRALQIFQELTLFHLKDVNKEALIHIDIDRINWVYQQAQLENKIQLKEKALSAITKIIENQAVAFAWLQLAKDKCSLAATYQPFQDSLQRWQYLAALKLIDEGSKIIQNDNTVKNELENLRLNILSKKLSIRTELIDIPNKPFRALVEYKNVDTLYYRILALPIEYAKPNDLGEFSIKKLCNKESLQQNKQWLPVTHDFQIHQVEIKLGPLPPGEYLLLASTGKNFNDTSDNINYQPFQVSNISLIQNKTDFFVLNRETGKPIPKSTITILSKSSNFQSKEWENEGLKITDENGYVKIEESNRYRNYSFIIESGNEKLRVLGYNLFESEDNTKTLSDSINFEKTNRRTFFFTDRSIYRPGQIVYFKAINSTIDFNNQKSKLLAYKSSTVYFRDVNYTIIDSLKFTSNEYGSYQGKFKIPEKVLTGNFSLTLKNGEIGMANFSVEAFKRPTFLIQFQNIDQPYKLNDSIEVKGIVKSFAGNIITEAKLTYQIIRSARVLYPYPRSIQYKYDQQKEITQGTIQTDNNGVFKIKFKAIPDLSKDSVSKPVFDFLINATATDASGETRTAIKQISCAYQSLILQINHPEILNAQKDFKIGIGTTNLNSENVHSRIDLKITELISPERLYKERYWPRPDQFVISKEDFEKDFPYDIYDNENEISNFTFLKTILTASFDTKKNKEWKIEAGKLKEGYYQIEAFAIDSLGNWEVTKSYLQVFDPTNNTVTTGKINIFYTNNLPMEPGEKDTVYSGTAAADIYIIRRIKKDKDNGSYQFINRKKGIDSYIYSASEKDRGGIFFEELFVFQNRIFINHFTKRIPFTNKELQINYQSFRDKTEPGSAEKWTVKITGKKGEKVASELLTSMYDASLDEFKIQEWNMPNWQNGKNESHFWKFNFGSEISSQNSINHFLWESDIAFDFDRIPSSFNDLWEISYKNHVLRKEGPFKYNKDGGQQNIPFPFEINDGLRFRTTNLLAAPIVVKSDQYYANGNFPIKNEIKKDIIETIIRNDFNETAFFFPQLTTDSTGIFQFNFTMPDAVTKWKWMSFAHTKDMSTGMQTAVIQTQKTLMVQSNTPRFLREGDKMEFSTRLSNLSDKELTGQITLELIDATTNTSVDGWFQNIFPTQYFTVGAKQTEAIKFPIQIPFNYNKPLIWRVVAKSGNYSDGEENLLAVLNNRALITESLPILVQGDTTQQFHFDKLLHQNSGSLSNESLTVEFSCNPIWYAVQALPYLKEGMDDCAEATFNKIYANSLAAYLVNKNPIIKTWFEKIKKDTASLISNLQKNQQLKQVLLEETPWVLAANTEGERKKNLLELFDLLKLAESNQSSIEKLQELQLPNGSFSWFKGGYADSYITSYILTGIGRLKRLGAITPDMAIRFKPMIVKAIQFTDDYINTEYQFAFSHGIDPNKKYINESQIKWLYMRSFYGDIAMNSTTASDFYFKQSKLYWNQFSVYYKSLIGLIQLRNKEEKFVGKTILPSLFENAVVDKQKGMYWKQTAGDWYNASIETASMVIELVSEYNQQNNSTERTKAIDAIKTWLILNKQTNNWKTSIKTANACYALLLNGTDWLQQVKTVQIALGNMVINSSNEKTELGTGYFEKRIDGSKVESEMGEIKITTNTVNSNNQKNNQPAWSVVYWQYFEDLDKITEAASPLNIQKQLMIEKVTDKGKELVVVDLNNPLKVGDKVVVRLVIKTNREMEYLHLKDLRAAGMEPVNILSGYKWQHGMGYYENTTDISSNFFINHLNKGTYVFEYPVYITHTGNFSVGIANIQCIYAPEFNSHSEGIRITVED